MRVLHTSDWHAGKILFGQDRTPDLEYALDQMLEIIEQDQVDLVLVAGDLYDTYRPPADATKVLHKFFLGLHQLKTPAVVISGNHDSSRFWLALQDLLGLAAIHVFDQPQAKSHVKFHFKGQDLWVTALPYPLERQLVKLSQAIGNTAEQRASYAHQVQRILAALAKHVPQSGHAILLSHLMIGGAVPGKSERPLSISDTFTVPVSALPEDYNYIALGHIHKRQEVKGTAAVAWYCGTPYAIDFHEAGVEKGVLLVDFEPERQPKVTFHPLKLKNQLIERRCLQSNLEKTCEELKAIPGYYKLVIQVEGASKGLADRARQLLGARLLRVQLEKPLAEETFSEHQSLALEKPLEVYRAYCEEQNRPMDAELEKTFVRLWQRVQENSSL